MAGELIWTLVGLAVIGLATLAGFVGRAWIKAYVDQSIKAKFDTELEGVRSDLRVKEGKITALQSNVLGGRAGRQAIIEKRRIEAAESLWASVIEYDKFNMAVMSIGLLKIDNVEKEASRNADFRLMIDTMSGGAGGDMKDHLPNNGIERHRPYLSEEIWKVYSIYVALMVYCFMKLKTLAAGIDGTDKIFNNKGVMDSIKEVMPHMSDYLDKYDISGATHLVKPLREMVLASVRSVLHGGQSDLENLAESRALLTALAELDAKFEAAVAKG